jgi:hypothetical protein
MLGALVLHATLEIAPHHYSNEQTGVVAPNEIARTHEQSSPLVIQSKSENHRRRHRRLSRARCCVFRMVRRAADNTRRFLHDSPRGLSRLVLLLPAIRLGCRYRVFRRAGVWHVSTHFTPLAFHCRRLLGNGCQHRLDARTHRGLEKRYERQPVACS